MGKSIIGRKIILVLLASCLFFIFLTGCGKKQPDNNALSFNKDGSITQYISEEFDIQNYDFDDWKLTAETEINEYNSANGDKVSIKDIKLEDNILHCTMTYADDDAYFDINNEPLFYGTIAQAITAGYSLLVPVTNIKTAEGISSAELQELKDYKIAIFSGERTVFTYRDIEYVSNNAGVGDDLKKAVITGDSTAYVVFK